MNERIESIKREICKVVVGKDRIVEKVMTAMIAGGHILLEDIPGVEAGGDGAVEGVLPDEVQGAPLEGIDLVVDEDVSRAGQGEQELVVVVEMEAAHVPGHIVIQL